MKNKFIALFMVLLIGLPAFSGEIGIVDYKKVLENYSKAKVALSQIDDRKLELQKYVLDKEKEMKKIESPIQKKTFSETTAKEYAKKEEACMNFIMQKEESINKDITDAIKSVALENKLDTVADYQAIYYGGVDITDKVIKKLNLK